MKKIRVCLIGFLFTLIVNAVFAQGKTKSVVTDNIMLMDSTINLYLVGDFYISGQPNDSMFIALKAQGLDLVINVRTPEEMETLYKEGFDEKAFLDSLGIAYLNVPIGGKYGYSKDVIESINSALELSDGSAMIHCRSAGRATNAWVAWLINYRHLPVNDAILLGKQMQLRFYIEDLLGYELHYNKKE